MKILALILLSVVLSGSGQLLLRSGAQSVPALTSTSILNPTALMQLFFNWQIATGLLAWVCSTVLWIVVLNRTALSFAYALGGLNYLIIPLLSSKLFDEQVSKLGFLGMGLIAIGVMLTLYARQVQ